MRPTPQIRVTGNGGASGARPAVSPVTVLVTRTEPSRGVIVLPAMTCTRRGSLGMVNVTESLAPDGVPFTLNWTGSQP